MAIEQYQFEKLGSREGFNASLIHFKAVSGILGDFESKINLADLIAELVADNTIEPVQIPSIVNALLVDKYGYSYTSVNLPGNLEDFSTILEETKKWKAVDIVIAYQHPELGLKLINPKRKEHWEETNLLKKDELVVIYVGGFGSSVSEKVCSDALNTLTVLLEGRTKKSPASLLKGSFTVKAAPKKEEPAAEVKTAKKKPGRKPAAGKKESAAPVKTAPEPAPAARTAPPEGGPKKMSPMYSVPVTNELFHNGNVEAWKRIIQSYTAKYPGCDVLIFYDGERIHDINTLFKWGKVKHGSAILFAVTGHTIQDVAKLRRYFQQGASPRFEDFLKFPVNQVLALF